jgi:MFS family permease
MSSKSKIATKLPYLQLGSAFAVQFSEAMNINVLFPFLAFMVESLGHGGPKLGYYAGGLAAAFCGAQFLSAVTLGVISDRYGRRSAMVLGSFGTGIGMLVFGFSTTYTQAVLGRFLSGLLCGNVGVLKSFLNEVTDETNRGSGFAMLSLAWAFGTIVAPLVG